MNLTPRFTNAVQKLYAAFQNHQLIPECACQCAVGTILDGKDYWKHFSDDHGSYQLNYVGIVNQKFGKRFNGYTPSELLQIEVAFLRGCGYELPLHYKKSRPTAIDQELVFDGFCEAITVMGKLDGCSNILTIDQVLEATVQREIINN